MNNKIKIILYEGKVAGVHNLKEGQDYSIVNLDEDGGGIYCENCDEYYADEEIENCTHQ